MWRAGVSAGPTEHASEEQNAATTCPSTARVKGGWALFADHGAKLGYIGLGLVTEHAVLEVSTVPTVA